MLKPSPILFWNPKFVPNFYCIPATIQTCSEYVPTKWTSTFPTGVEPLVETGRMEFLLTSFACDCWQRVVGAVQY